MASADDQKADAEELLIRSLSSLLSLVSPQVKHRPVFSSRTNQKRLERLNRLALLCGTQPRTDVIAVVASQSLQKVTLFKVLHGQMTVSPVMFVLTFRLQQTTPNAIEL